MIDNYSFVSKASNEKNECLNMSNTNIETIFDHRMVLQERKATALVRIHA